MDIDATASRAAFRKPASDICFTCPHCTSALVVAVAAAGLKLNCEQCKAQITVPAVGSCADQQNSPAEVPNGRLAELKRSLKENESQRTEISGYINQHRIQLHRWQLRLQTLDERKKELVNQIAPFT